jgi:hypothetical protein
MSQTWYYKKDGRQFGPVPIGQLKQLAFAGQLDPTGYVRREGTEDWISASKVKGLFPSPDELKARRGRRPGTGEADDPEIAVKPQHEARTRNAPPRAARTDGDSEEARLAAWAARKGWDAWVLREGVAALLESRAGYVGGGLVILSVMARPWAPASDGVLRYGFATLIGWLVLLIALGAMAGTIAAEFHGITWRNFRLALAASLLGLVVCGGYWLWTLRLSWRDDVARTDFLHTGTFLDHLIFGPSLALVGFGLAALFNFGALMLYALNYASTE